MDGKPRLIFKAQRFGTNEWLSHDLPLRAEGPEHGVSTYAEIRATISPDLGEAIADDGRRVLQPGGTWIHIETPDERIWTGYVHEVNPGKGAELNVTIREWLGYLDGLVFQGRIWGVRADPADLVRELFAHIQSYPGGKLGARVVGQTPVPLGTDSDDRMIAAKRALDQAVAALKAREKPRKAKAAEIKRKSAPHDRLIKARNTHRAEATKAYEQLTKQRNPKATKEQLAAARAVVKTRSEATQAAREAKKREIDPLKQQLEQLRAAEETFKKPVETARENHRKAQERARADGGAWKALPEDTPDCWSILRDLAAETPFDFTTRTERTHSAPKLTLRIDYLRAGRAREDLVFEQGVNIVELPEPRIPSEYATEIIGLGAGEGESFDGSEIAMRVNVPVSDWRMRRTSVLSLPSITNKTTLRVLARREQRSLRGERELPELVVREHENCPIGSWSAGDDIYVKLHSVPHFGRITGWFRVRTWQRIGLTRARIRLERIPDV